MRGDKNWYLKSIHSSFINFLSLSFSLISSSIYHHHHPFQTWFFALSLYSFLYKNIYPFFWAVSSHRAVYNAQWKCLVRFAAECLLISLDEICIHFTSLYAASMVHQFLCFFAFSILARWWHNSIYNIYIYIYSYSSLILPFHIHLYKFSTTSISFDCWLICDARNTIEIFFILFCTYYREKCNGRGDFENFNEFFFQIFE